MALINPHIFRAYDIRGKAYEQLDEEACMLIGRAFGSVLKGRTEKEHPIVCVGRDARVHSPAFAEAAIKGLMQSGCAVLNIGLTPSPVNYFTVCTQQCDGGLQVTASHNPAHDNGIKLCTADADAFSGDDLQELRQRIENDEFVSGEGTYELFDALTPYASRISDIFQDAAKGLRIAVDGGNGAAGPTASSLLRAVGAEVTELYTEPDGTFPNHPADPSKWDTLKDLQATVVEHALDIGFAFDGDGDRLGLVDEKGIIHSADELLLLLAHDHLVRFPGAPVVFTVSNSGILKTEIAAWGGIPVMCKVGHSFVEHAMREHNALLGGEQSGHFFCGENYFSFDDALVAALRIVSILQERGQLLSALFAEFPRVYQMQEKRPHVEDTQKSVVIERVIDHYRTSPEIITLDGVRIDFQDGSWFGIRQSNTSPCISICIEARSPERLEELETSVLSYLKEFPEISWEG